MKCGRLDLTFAVILLGYSQAKSQIFRVLFLKADNCGCSLALDIPMQPLKWCHGLHIRRAKGESATHQSTAATYRVTCELRTSNFEARPSYQWYHKDARGGTWNFAIGPCISAGLRAGKIPARAFACCVTGGRRKSSVCLFFFCLNHLPEVLAHDSP